MRRPRKQSAEPAARLNNRYNVEAISRAARLLRQFTRNTPAHTVADLAAATHISSDLVHRSLTTLQAHGLIHSSSGAADDSYTLGLTWLRYADVRRRQFNIRFVALPVMRRMRDTVDETIILAIRTGDRRVNIEYIESMQAIRRLTQLGFEVPLHVGATGRTLLSGLSPEDVKAYLDRTAVENFATTPSAARIVQDVENVRTRGYAIGFREITSETAAVSAPIKDHLGQVAAALTISCPDERFDKALERRCIDCVLAGAADVSQALGFHAAGDDH
jgi:DNA-binding IclR family transcriptional regulator